MADSFDVIIVGGSYAGLSAALALGRSLRQVLIIDSGHPCNQQTPHAHNFITHDGETPMAIAENAKAELLRYDTVRFFRGVATSGEKMGTGFTIRTQSGETFMAKKLLFATGLIDEMPSIEGFAACWGISVLHCPYCHGYEVKHQPIGLIGNGDVGFELCRLLQNWTKQLTLFTNGRSVLTVEQTLKIKSHQIDIIEKEIIRLEHTNGKLENIVFADQTNQQATTLFARPGLRQHCEIPEQLGCKLTEQGFIQVDDFYRTTVAGIFAAGDNTTLFRALSVAVAAGTKAGALLNKELVEEAF